MHKFNHDFSCILAIFAVSLFTREWIEIPHFNVREFRCSVSLFTREWIEIALGLSELIVGNRLPLYEGVD